MLFSPYDILGALERFIGSVMALLPENTGKIGSLIAFAVLFRIGVKILSGRSKTGGVGRISVPSEPDSAEPSDAPVDAGNAGGGNEQSNDKQIDPEKQKEEERLKAQEQLKDLFEMVQDDGERKKRKTQEEKELEALGLEREDLERLKEQYKNLTIEISSLLEKGLSAEQTAKTLSAKTAEQIPLMELQPLIEAMTQFLKQNGNAEKNTAVIGVDPRFEQRAALSALKRGDYETALGFLERRAVEAMNRASSSHRSDICAPSLEQASSLYRAIGVLTRPLDPERSFEALKKSKELSGENTLTDALIARAYYESGKTKKAENIFESITEHTGENDFAAQYASQMVSHIRTERTMQHAHRIREDYENRLGDVEGRQKADHSLLQQKHRAEVARANSRFLAAEEVRERDNEREFG